MRSPLDVLYNFHWVKRNELGRSAQAYAGMLGPFLRRHGIRSVINLRGRNPKHRWWRYESRICRQLAVQRYELKFNSRALPSRELLIEMLRAFDGSEKPALIKCSGGQDRTSFAAALYVVQTDGWGSIANALNQFARWPYLHFPKKQQHWLRMFLTYAFRQANGLTLAEWIESKYIPEQFMDWLDKEGLRGSFRNLPGQSPRT